ncbi:hypothetical protein BDV59DRAFT_197583 [Aspergillus ambiguus]|uniref:uncharacterized protein n=1 Tax=Aspergillus ambiguus TaxID=176160 RepID=UPI003CCCEF08
MAIVTNEDQATFLTTRSVNATKTSISITYPIAPSVTREGTFKHPYFTFQLLDFDAGSATFEWQIHPSRHGRMRYTLVRTSAPQQQQQESRDDDIQPVFDISDQQEFSVPDVRAIYYHVGVGASLLLPYSEGVLLLPVRQNSVIETFFVLYFWHPVLLHKAARIIPR